MVCYTLAGRFSRIFENISHTHPYRDIQSTVTMQCSTHLSLYCYHIDHCYHTKCCYHAVFDFRISHHFTYIIPYGMLYSCGSFFTDFWKYFPHRHPHRDTYVHIQSTVSTMQWSTHLNLYCYHTDHCYHTEGCYHAVFDLRILHHYTYISEHTKVFNEHLLRTFFFGYKKASLRL